MQRIIQSQTHSKTQDMQRDYYLNQKKTLEVSFTLSCGSGTLCLDRLWFLMYHTWDPVFNRSIMN